MTGRRSNRRWARILLLAGAGTAAWCAPAPATDFIRGDVNGDRSVSVSDAYAIVAHLFWGARAPECEAAADIKEDESVNITDAVVLLNHLALGGDAPPSPFPAPGPDPTPDLPCDAYGSGAPLDDPVAALRILEATAPGGDDGRVKVTLAVSSSRHLGGLSGSIRPRIAPVDGEGILEALNGPESSSFHGASVKRGSVAFAFLPALVEDVRIPPGTDVPLLELTFCLPPGALAGEYALDLEAGELIDAATSRAIRPVLEGGTVTVLADVVGPGPCAGEPTGEPPAPEDVHVEFRVGSTEAGEDRRAQVPFVLRADVPVGAYSFSLDFDEDVLEATEVEVAWRKPDGSDYGFKVFRTNNERERPGNGGVDEGWVLGAAVFDLQAPVTLPANTDNLLIRLHFGVRPGSAAGVTEIRFLDGAQLRGSPPTRNVISAFGKSYPPDLGSSYVFINGFVNVLPDGTLFIRGDSNGDGAVDVADARRTLGYLFQGGERPACDDAADANDDGAINVTDPVAVLRSLFLGTGPLPAPHGAAGEDPTPDGLGCLG
jgi:hypothetical protein